MNRQHQWTRTTVRLARDGLLGIDDGRGLRLRVASGAVWLTQQDDGRDVVLREGESFVIDRPGPHRRPGARPGGAAPQRRQRQPATRPIPIPD